MPGETPEAIAEIIQEIEDAMALLEDRLSGHAERIESFVDELEQQRAVVQSAVEEHQLEAMLAGQESDEDDEALRDLRRHEDSLRDQHTAVSSLYRQVSGFAHLLTGSRQRFDDGGELPGLEDGQRLAVREAIIRAQEDERRRLAREIHDGPAQVLANAIIGLEFVDRSLQQATLASGGERLTTELERVKAAMREGLMEIRRFIFDLKPSMLNQRGLAATVEHYIQSYRHLFAGDIHLEIPNNLPHLTPEQEMTAFRVIQESLQNVHKHARSTQTWVSISSAEDGLLVEVRDNGQGFRPSTTGPSLSGGFGLVGMRERAEVLGARLSVESEPGTGTSVRLVIPLNRRALRPSRERDLRRKLKI